MKEELSKGWELVTFSELFDINGGSQPPKSTFSDSKKPGYVRLLQIRDFSSDRFAIYIPDTDKWPKCTEEDIMIGRYGASIGRVLTGKAGAYNVAMVKIIYSRKNLVKDWVKFFLGSSFFQNPIALLSRSAQNGFNKSDLAPILLPLPPLPEQRRIVAKIEALQERSDRARAALAAVPPLLEKFRQSVLAAAFRGDLTKEWRKKHPHAEPASELLARIRTERRRRWEESELAKMRAKGQTPKDNAWKKKYQEPAPVDDTDLPELPVGWVWSNTAGIAFVEGGLTRNNSLRSNTDLVVPLVTVAAVRLRHIDAEGISEIGILPEDGDKAKLLKDDLLVVEGNGSLEHIGRVALWDNSIPNARHQNHLIRIRPIIVTPQYLLEWMASPEGRNLLINEATSAAGLYNLSLSKVGRIALPIPPIDEQLEIMRRIHELWEIFPNIEASSSKFLHRFDGLSKSILAKAFRGELVPQDPNDEPASVLLARIRAEREKSITKHRTRRKQNGDSAGLAMESQESP